LKTAAISHVPWPLLVNLYGCMYCIVCNFMGDDEDVKVKFGFPKIYLT